MEKGEKKKLQNKQLFVTIALALLLLISLFPAYAFIYPNGTTDNRYEYYGPHADFLQFRMYGSTDALWIALSQGEIDLTDWPLTTSWRANAPPNGFNGDPNVVVANAGGEVGFCTVDFNYMKYPQMGADTYGRTNPVYTVISGYSKSIHGVPGIPPISSNVYFRFGMGCLFNRTAYQNYLGAGGVSILTPIPAYMAGWIWSSAYSYPYSRSLAEANFTAGHILQDKSVMPWVRYWDHNENGVRDTGEADACVLKMTWRMDAYRKKAGEMLYAELQAMNFTFNPTYTGQRTGGSNYQQVMLDKDYHITTLGWINVGPDPDHLYNLYHINNYWDSMEAACPNTAALNDTVLNTYAENLRFAPDTTAALTAALNFQMRFEAICAQIPLYSGNRFMAHRKWYSGGNAEAIVGPDDGENIYRRVGGVSGGAKREWLGVCNQMGFGSNSWWSLLNMYPNCTLYPTEYPNLGKITIRYGWKEQQYPQHINPFYSSCYWDSIVLDATYDTLGYRDPYDLTTWKCDLIKSWTVGTWRDGTIDKSKVRITLRPDVKWHDGTPMTITDVVFSLVEAGPLLLSKGYYPPWWWPTGELVRSWKMIDPYTVEILYDVQSYMAESWTLGGFYIIPKHIWKPIIQSGSPTTFCPDPNLIGSGPWRYYSYILSVSLVMVANKPGVTITTDMPGSSPITTPGPRFWNPIHVNIHLKPPNEYRTRINIPHSSGSPPTTNETNVAVKVTLHNWWLDARNTGTSTSLLVNKYVYVDGYLLPGYPVDVSLQGCVPEEEQIPLTLAIGYHTVKVAVHVKGPTELFSGKPNPWISQWTNVTQPIWVAIAEDIGGAWFDTWNNPPQIPAPDFRVDVLDVSMAARAFGSYPGHPRWNPVADINNDYKIDAIDISTIAKMFGWGVTPPSREPQDPMSKVRLYADTSNSPPKTVVCCNYNFTVHIKVVNVTNLYAYEIRLEYNPNLLNLAAWQITAPSTWGTSVYPIPGQIAITAMGLATPFTGNATIARLTFTAKMKGNATLDPSTINLVQLSSMFGVTNLDYIHYIPISSWIITSMVGDVTSEVSGPYHGWPDGRCDMSDVYPICKLFGVFYPDARYNPNCDITNDNRIDMSDIYIVAKNFGKMDP